MITRRPENAGGDARRLLVFGGSGFVGGHIAAAAGRAGWRVSIASHRMSPGVVPAARYPVDVGDAAAVAALFDAVRPDAVVNAAAQADVDRAERERELAWRVNAEGARNVAACAQAQGARCIYFSTDVVFDGERSAYAERDPVAPLNHYGRSKAEGERLTLVECPDAAIIRVSLVLGFPLERGNAYLPKLRDRLLAGQTAPSPADEIRTPVDVETVATATLELLNHDFSGPLHIGATQVADRYTLARMLTAEMGLPQALILPYAVYPAGDPTVIRAPRHRNGVLTVRLAQEVLRTPMLSLDETVRRAVRTLKPASPGL